jgi:hypothetical protein
MFPRYRIEAKAAATLPVKVRFSTLRSVVLPSFWRT